MIEWISLKPPEYLYLLDFELFGTKKVYSNWYGTVYS